MAQPISTKQSRTAYFAQYNKLPGGRLDKIQQARNYAHDLGISTVRKSMLALEIEISLAHFRVAVADVPDLENELRALWELNRDELLRKVQPPAYWSQRSRPGLITYFMRSRIPLPPGPLVNHVPVTPPQAQAPHGAGPGQPPDSLRESLEFWYVVNTLRGTVDFGPSFEGTVTLYIGSARSPYTYTVRVLVPPASTDIAIPAGDRSEEYDWTPAPLQTGFPSEEQLRHAVASGRFTGLDEARDAHEKSLDALKHVMASCNGSSNTDLCVLERSIHRERDMCVRHKPPLVCAALARGNGPSIFEVSTGDDYSLEIIPSWQVPTSTRCARTPLTYSL